MPILVTPGFTFHVQVLGARSIFLRTVGGVEGR